MESPYGEKLRELVKVNHLEDSVYFAGMLSGDSKWGAFYGCESFVLPSHQENFGIAVL
jgi:glycosyltransferase involved in cell wall biosynthesis